MPVSLMLEMFVCWKKTQHRPSIVEVVKKTKLNNWKLFETIKNASSVVDLLFGWLLENTSGLVRKDQLTMILENKKLNEQINNLICFSESYNLNRRRMIVDSIKFSLATYEFQISCIIADFFLYLYRENEETDKETFTEALLSLSSLIVGNKTSKDIEDAIFETELFSRILKAIILSKSIEDDKSELDNSVVSVINKITKSIHHNSSKFDMVSVFQSEKRDSTATYSSLLSMLKPLTSGSNLIKSKFGSNSSNLTGLFSEKSGSLIRINTNNVNSQPRIPLSKFEMPKVSFDSNPSAKVDLVSARRSTATYAFVNQIKKTSEKVRASANSDMARITVSKFVDKQEKKEVKKFDESFGDDNFISEH